MSSSTAGTRLDPALSPQSVDLAVKAADFWWLRLITGVLWVVASLIILQFNHASVTTVGIIVGCLFMATAVEQLILLFVADRLRWLWGIFCVLFFVCGILAFVNPEATFAGFADMLGFLFLVVGVWWTISAFLERESSSLWWLGLVSGILMLVMAFWVSGQLFIHKAYTLLVLAGAWALMHGIMEIVRAFTVRSLRDRL